MDRGQGHLATQGIVGEWEECRLSTQNALGFVFGSAAQLCRVGTLPYLDPLGSSSIMQRYG